MNLIGPGLYEVEDPMPCAPKDLRIWRYQMPGTFGSAQREEAAARILSFSRDANRWVGVSLDRLAQMVSDDIIARHQFYATRRYQNICFWTFGIYSWIVSKPAGSPNASDHDGPDKIVTGIFGAGPGFVADGIYDLFAQGYLCREQVRQDGGDTEVYSPTPVMISRIVQVQNTAPQTA